MKFDAAVVNTTTDADGNETVLVRSSADSTGIRLRLTERTATGGASRIVGQYSAKFIVVADTDVPADLYSTFDEKGVGVNLNGPVDEATDDDGDGRGAGFLRSHRPLPNNADGTTPHVI